MAYAADSLFAKIVGANPTIASLVALGGQAATHVQNFRRYEPGHYAYGKKQGTNYWATSNYYDRAFIYYAWHAAETGAAADDYLRKAHELTLNYRTNYAPNGDVAAHWSMPCGVALHAITANDATSKSWIMKVSDTFSLPYYADGVGDPDRGEMDCRIQGRFLEAHLLAYLLSEGSAKYATILRKGLDDIIATQKSNGSRVWADQNNGSKPFMDGVLNDALMLYRRGFEDDDRILPHIKKNCDWLWANMWKAPDKAFQYNQNVPGEQESAPDLNNLIVGGYMANGMADQVKAIFEGSFNAWLDGDKQFNQTYRESHRTCAQFGGAVSAWEGEAPVEPPVEPPIDPPTGEEPDVEGAKADLVLAHNALDQAYAAIDAALLKLG